MPLSVEDLRVGLAIDGTVQTSLTPPTPDMLLASTPAAIGAGDVQADVQTGEVLPAAADETGGADPAGDADWPHMPPSQP